MVAHVSALGTNASSSGALCEDSSDASTNFMSFFFHLPAGENREEALYSRARLATRDKRSL